MNAQTTNTHSQRNLGIIATMLALLILAAAAAILLLIHLRFGVGGTVTDALSGAPLAGVEITAGGLGVHSDAQGSYTLRRAPRDGQFTFALDGYQTARPPALAAAWLATSISLDVALQPAVLEGTVSDAATRQPVAGASMFAGDETAVTTAEGAYRFLRVKRDTPIIVRADGYDEHRLVCAGEPIPSIDLAQNAVSAAVLDESDATSIASARLSNDGQAAAPAGAGRFVLRGVKMHTELAAQADGYLPATLRYNGGPAVTITLAANSVGGAVYEQSTGRPLSGITITLAQASDVSTTISDGAGGFRLRRVGAGAVLTAAGPEHATTTITYTGQPSIAFTLRLDLLRGDVRDRYSGQAMAGVTVTLLQADATRTVRSDDGGRFQFSHAPLGALVSSSSAGHATSVVTYTGQLSVHISLRPDTLRGVVRDGRNNQPVAGAEVSVGSVKAKTSASGAYELAGIPEGLPLIVIADGFDRTPVTLGLLTTMDVRLQPVGGVHAIYIPFYLLTIPDRVRALISFAERAGMNGIVVDIKADDGYIAYKSSLPLAQEIKAQWPGEMMSLEEVLTLARQRGMYAIARMVVFKDNLLAEARPDLAVKDKRTGLAWDDCGTGSTLWADPFRKEVVDYNAGIAEEAARMGFDEIQFDYIRFPPACIVGAPLADAAYLVTPTMETRLAAIEAFLAEAQRRLKPRGVAIAVDTFGWTLYRDDDMAIGQRMENMAKYVDYICPMVYPSTWEPGANGLDYVPAHPYEIVYQSVSFGVNRLKAIPGVKMRPWLQDFNDYQYKKLPYGVKEVEAQRRAAYDAGALGWMLWNAGGSYTEEDVFRP